MAPREGFLPERRALIATQTGCACRRAAGGRGIISMIEPRGPAVMGESPRLCYMCTTSTHGKPGWRDDIGAVRETYLSIPCCPLRRRLCEESRSSRGSQPQVALRRESRRFASRQAAALQYSEYFTCTRGRSMRAAEGRIYPVVWRVIYRTIEGRVNG